MPLKQYVEDTAANEQIILIANLLIEGHSDERVAQTLTKRNVTNLAKTDGTWIPEDVTKIRVDFRLYSCSRADIDKVLLTTETHTDLDILERLEVISAETAFGMNLFKDFFAGLSDVFGGRSGATQKILRDARRAVLSELKEEAYQLGANAVVAVDLDYSEFSGGGKSMLFVVATGTAVKIAKQDRNP